MDVWLPLHELPVTRCKADEPEFCELRTEAAMDDMPDELADESFGINDSGNSGTE